LSTFKHKYKQLFSSLSRPLAVTPRGRLAENGSGLQLMLNPSHRIRIPGSSPIVIQAISPCKTAAKSIAKVETSQCE
jgi:hypothetical protein